MKSKTPHRLIKHIQFVKHNLEIYKETLELLKEEKGYEAYEHYSATCSNCSKCIIQPLDVCDWNGEGDTDIENPILFFFESITRLELLLSNLENQAEKIMNGSGETNDK